MAATMEETQAAAPSQLARLVQVRRVLNDGRQSQSVQVVQVRRSTEEGSRERWRISISIWSLSDDLEAG
jgi:hypothetical protein